jgi:hypothetical protein
VLKRFSAPSNTSSFSPKYFIMRIFYTFLFSAGFFAAGAQHTFLVEHFDYPAGAPLTMHGWTAHSASGTSPILVSEAGLSMEKNHVCGQQPRKSCPGDQQRLR